MPLVPFTFLHLRGCQTNDKIGRFYLPTKSPDKNLSCVMQKSPNNRPRYSMFYIRRFCRPTFRMSDNKFCLFCHGGCLQRKMNIYFSYLLCLLLFSFIRCRKKVMQVLFCDLHSAVVLADIV